MSQSQSFAPEVADVLSFIERKIVEGIKHGHFDITITCAMGNKKQRELLVKPGKKHKFNIPADKVPRRSLMFATPVIGAHYSIVLRSRGIGVIPRVRTRGAVAEWLRSWFSHGGFRP